MSAIASAQITNAQRERWLVGWFVCIALVLGAFAAAGSSSWLGVSVIVLCLSVVAMTVPLTWLAPILAALIPLQLYFNIPGTSFTMRGAVVFALVIACRLLVVRLLSHQHLRAVQVFRAKREISGGENGISRSARNDRIHAWMYPAAIFLLVAFIAAFGASNRYAAFRGLYDYGILFAVAFVASETLQSTPAIRRTIFVLIGAGIFQAIIGLWEVLAGIDAVVRFLPNEPIVELFWQSSLLRASLLSWSVNWIVFDRVAAFGTFINSIDYAIFLAAILSLVLALIIARFEKPVISTSVLSEHSESKVHEEKSPTRDAEISRSVRNDIIHPRSSTLVRVQLILLVVIAFVIGSALLWTFKGSGLVAIASGAATIGLLYFSRLSRRVIAFVGIAFGVAIILALPFADLLAQRLSFLILREQGAYGTAGRIEIWTSMFQFSLQRPIFGYGLHNSIYLPQAARSMLGGALVFNATSTESSYVAILLETGIVGFVALMSVFVIALQRAYRSIQTSFSHALTIGVIAAMIAILAGNLTVAGFTSDHNEMLLGLFVGMAFANWNDENQTSEISEISEV